MKMAEKAKKTSTNEQKEQINAEINEGSSSNQQAQVISADEYKAVIEDLNDKVLRAMAESQNTRRRADIDIQNAKSFGIQSFAKDLLGVMDNLFRASEAISEEDATANPKLKSIKDGVEITKREMINVFERNGIKRIEPIGEIFDPNLHQAISQVPDGDLTPGTVMQVLQSGYVLKDRLIRPALVVVSKVAE